MSCRKAFDIDLAGFLEEPRTQQFDAFRAHYPRCAACASEVRAWTELHEQLGRGRHPSPESLAGYAELPTVARASIDRHAAQCPACREELRLLDAFDPVALAQPAVARIETRERDGWLVALARLLWHPAFAYGMALLLVVPILWRTQGPGRFADGPPPPAAPWASVPAQRSEVRGDAAPAKRGEPSPPIRASVAKPATQPDAKSDVLEESVAAATAEVPKAAIEAARPSAAMSLAPVDPPERVRVPESDVAVLRPTAQRSEAEPPLERRLAAAQERKRAQPVFEASAADALSANAPAPRPAGAFDSAGSAFADAAPPAPISLAPIALASAPEQVSVRVPVVAGARRSVEVVVSDAQGTRALRQRAEATPERGDVAIELPRTWLSPGEYRVELHDGSAPVRVFALPVVAR